MRWLVPKLIAFLLVTGAVRLQTGMRIVAVLGRF
tara:strand:+ start:247 stop:348 length:102 start_codon:yes stop_codon:yes gene_type:complete